MHLKVSITDQKIEKMIDQVSSPCDYIIVWVYLSPHIKIMLSFPGVSYVGAAMVAEACPDGRLKFECCENPLRLSDKQLFLRRWPPGAWHFLMTLHAVEEWLANELGEFNYKPQLQNMIFRLIDEIIIPATR